MTRPFDHKIPILPSLNEGWIWLQASWSYEYCLLWNDPCFMNNLCLYKNTHSTVHIYYLSLFFSARSYWIIKFHYCTNWLTHYGDVIMGAIASQTTSLTMVYSTVYSDADQRKHQSSASQAFVRGVHQWPVNSPNKWPVTWKMFPFDDVIM